MDIKTFLKGEEKKVRLFCVDVAECLLEQEVEQHRTPSPDAWEAVAVAKRFATGEASRHELWEANQMASWAAYRKIGGKARLAHDCADFVSERKYTGGEWIMPHVEALSPFWQRGLLERWGISP